MKTYSEVTTQAKQQLRGTLQKQQAKASEEKHDERNFDVEESRHIDNEKVKDDVFVTWLDTEEKSFGFEEAVLKAYEEFYTPHLKRINDNYVKDRHAEKQKTMEEFLASNRPEAFILQIGNCLDNVDADTLRECVEDYLDWEEEWNEEHGRPFEILTLALHADEASNHIHGLKAWKARDKHGNLIPNREKALEQAGVELPNPGKKVSRYNNRNMTFTAMCRDKWLDICEEHGFDIIREPIKDVKGKKQGDFIREREKDYQERMNALETAEKANLDMEIQNIQEAYAIGSVSLLQADKTQELSDWENRLEDKHFELCETVMAVQNLEDSAREYCLEAKKYLSMSGDNSRASLMAEFMSKCKMGNATAYNVFCMREPQLAQERAKKEAQIQRDIDKIINKVASRNRNNDYDFDL